MLKGKICYSKINIPKCQFEWGKIIFYHIAMDPINLYLADYK